MKTKKFDKKLMLNKKTVANLEKTAMEGIKGGLVTKAVWSGCPTWCPWTCIMC